MVLRGMAHREREMRTLALWCEAAARRATGWLEASLSQSELKESAVQAPAEGYAGILSSATIGALASASHLMAVAVSHWMVSPGEFHVLDEPEAYRRRTFLRNSCLLLAGCRLGRLDVVSRPAVERLLAYQHRSGGFFEMDPAQGHGLVDAFTTAWGGRVALRLCRYERARAAAHLLAEMLYMQPDPDRRFYFCYDTLASSLVTRWRGEIPQSRYLDFEQVTGETHQLGMALSFMAEMHLTEPAAGWGRPLAGLLQAVGRWPAALLRQHAMATMPEGLGLAMWALERAAGEAAPRLAEALDGVSQVLSPAGAFPSWECGVGREYERGFSAVEATGWGALCLAGLAHALANVKS